MKRKSPQRDEGCEYEAPHEPKEGIPHGKENDDALPKEDKEPKDETNSPQKGMKH